MSNDRYRFTTPQPWDRQPGLWVMSTLSVLLSLLVFGGRWTIRRRFSSPDMTLSIAYVLAAASWIALYLGLSRGAGIAAVHVSMSEYNSAGKAVFASNIALVAAQGMASCSQIIHLQEIVPSTREKRICLIALAVCCTGFCGAIICISAQCSPSHAMNTSTRASCDHGVARWAFASILIAVQTIIPAVLPIRLFKVLQSTSSKKRSVLAAFSFPTLNFVTIIVMLWSYISSIEQDAHGTGLVNHEICLQVLLGWSLVCPTIPCIRPLAMRFTTGGAIVLAGEMNHTGSVSSRHKSQTDPQSRRRLRSHFQRGFEQKEQDELELNPRMPCRSVSNIRISDDDRQESIESTPVTQAGIHVSHRYEVFSEEVVR